MEVAHHTRRIVKLRDGQIVSDEPNIPRSAPRWRHGGCRIGRTGRAAALDRSRQMNLFDTIPIAIRALAANKMRSMLTMLGIIIGVGAVITLMAAGQGAQKGITDRIQGLGSNLLFIRPGQARRQPDERPHSADQVLTLVMEDAEAINNPDRFPYVESVTSQVFFDATLSAGGKTLTGTSVTGVDAGLPAHARPLRRERPVHQRRRHHA